MRHTANLDQPIARAAGEERINPSPEHAGHLACSIVRETPGTSNSADEISRKWKMSQPERHEMLILGSGAGGKLLAWHMAKSGRRTADPARACLGARGV
jgi:hypothetical protein